VGLINTPGVARADSTDTTDTTGTNETSEETESTNESTVGVMFWFWVEKYNVTNGSSSAAWANFPGMGVLVQGPIQLQFPNGHGIGDVWLAEGSSISANGVITLSQDGDCNGPAVWKRVAAPAGN
jgi:hypothetical protein